MKRFLSPPKQPLLTTKGVHIKLIELIQKPLSISALLHILILLVLALVSIKPQHHIKWHTFEWEQVFTTPLPKTQGDSKAEDQLNSGEMPIVSNDSDIDDSVSPTETSTPQEGISDFIETPRRDRTQRNPSVASIPAETRAVTYFKNLPYGGRSGQGMGDGSGYDFDGQGVNILDRVVPNVTVTNYGTITMQFRLGSDGRVVQESITVLSYTASEYIQASVTAIAKWRFSFVGRYDASKVYKITFVYNPS